MEIYDHGPDSQLMCFEHENMDPSGSPIILVYHTYKVIFTLDGDDAV